jgi:hypothetical protein
VVTVLTMLCAGCGMMAEGELYTCTWARHSLAQLSSLSPQLFQCKSPVAAGSLDHTRHRSFFAYFPYFEKNESGGDGGDGLQIWRVAANILNKQSRTADKGWSSSLGVGRGANNSLP